MASSSSSSSSTEDTVPYYLMPVAAVLGMYSLFMSIRLMYFLYANLTYSSASSKLPPSVRLWSRDFALLLATLLGALFGYAKIVASIEHALAESEYALFDPYDILGLSESSNSTQIKSAYRTMSKLHHPDKGGDEDMFQKVHTAYRALTSDRDAYEAHGHPDGRLTQQALAFALPEWLLNPQGTVAVVLLVLYLAMFVGIVYFVFTWTTKSNKDAEKSAKDMSVAGADTAYLAATLGPESTHMDVLLCIATTPENILVTSQSLERINDMRARKLAKKSEKPAGGTANFDLDDSGWDEDDATDEATIRAKQEEELRAKEKAQLDEATGNLDAVPMEGLDDNVLGQIWVESVMSERGKNWPPRDLRFLEGKKFSYNGKTMSAMDHPAIRRNLCFVFGRLNSILLNTHPDLLESHSKKLIDQTYFKGSLEFRQRVGLLLEASLRVAAAMQSYRLAKTIVETVAMFKVGVMEPASELTLKWFNGTMRKTYGEAGLPRLGITDLTVETAGEDEIATGDLCTLSYTMDRLHAENFTKVKVALCQKQGIPPQVALQTYREGWWFLVRAKKVDGGETPLVTPKENPLAKLLQASDIQKYDSEKGDNRLLVAWPMIVQNMAQKAGKIKIQFRAPLVPGKYKIAIAIKSQEFLGADQDFELPITVVDAASVQRKEEEDDEAKKDK